MIRGWCLAHGYDHDPTSDPDLFDDFEWAFRDAQLTTANAPSTIASKRRGQSRGASTRKSAPSTVDS